MKPGASLLAVACALSVGSGRAMGQQVLGTVRRAADSSAVPGALVELRDSVGLLIGRGITSERGDFLFTLPATGRYSLRVLRIGFVPSRPEVVRAPARGALGVRLYVEEQPIVLTEVAISASRPECGAASGGTVVGQLFAEAQKAIALTQATLDAHKLTFNIMTWTRHLTPNLRTMDSTGAPSIDRGWPIRSAPPESLRVWGFVRDERDSDGRTSAVYYGPDAAVFLADWFLETRCLRLTRSEDSSALVLEFTPSRRRDAADIEGRLVFDSASLALRELRFQWVGLPDWVPPRNSAGGFIRFQSLPSGEWLPVEWALRAPVPEVRNPVLLGGTVHRETRLAMYLETGGRAELVR